MFGGVRHNNGRAVAFVCCRGSAPGQYSSRFLAIAPIDTRPDSRRLAEMEGAAPTLASRVRFPHGTRLSCSPGLLLHVRRVERTTMKGREDSRPMLLSAMMCLLVPRPYAGSTHRVWVCRRVWEIGRTEIEHVQGIAQDLGDSGFGYFIFIIA